LPVCRSGTLFDAGKYPRHRVCGEFITGLSPATIARLGLGPLLADALQHERVAWFLGSGPPREQTLPSPALALSRYSLDERLARAFVAAGGDLRANTRVTDLAARAGRVFATGRRRATSSRWLGLKIHAHDLPLTCDLEMHLGEHCYVGLTRVENGAVNVCGLFRRRSVAAKGPAVLLAYLRAAGLDALAHRLAIAQLEVESFSAVAALEFDGRVRASSRLHIGDASAITPPFTGNGMAMAFQSAELALEPLIAFARSQANWAETCRATNAALRGRFRVRLVSAKALHPFLLRPRRQRWMSALLRARLVPFAPLYATLH
jgi:flavin-dependent dehydrogenase